MEKWKYEIKEKYVWVGKRSAGILLIPNIIKPRYITAIVTVPVTPVEKGWSVNDKNLVVSEFQECYCAPDKMDFDEAVTRLMRYFKEKARRCIRLVFAQEWLHKCNRINPFTGEEWQDERKKG